MNIEVDTSAKALYLRLAAGRVADTVELADTVVADLDETGNLLGIEFVRVEQFAPFVAAHPDLVALPRHLAYTSVDRNRRWHVEIGGNTETTNGDPHTQVAMMNGAFLAEIVADPELVDRIVNDEIITLDPAPASTK